MQRDNGVRSTAGGGDQRYWSLAFADELTKMIKASYGTQVALVAHMDQAAADTATRHEKYPHLSKQQLSKRLKKPTPDWPLANMIIKCCTHDDAAATARELARLAGIHQAATGHRPKGYNGPLTVPAVAVVAGDLAGGPHEELRLLRSRLETAHQQLTGYRTELAARMVDRAAIQALRGQLAGAQERLAGHRAELAARDREIDLLSRQVRTSSSAQMSAQTRLSQVSKQIEHLRVQLSDATALYQDQAAQAKANESRLHTLWERYALLNASRESTSGQPVITLGTTAMNPGGRTWQIDPDAPASRRVFAVYLQSYRELAERSLTAIAEATGLGRAQLTAILSAEVAPSLEVALAVAAAITAPTATVRRLHATMADDPSTVGRPVNDAVEEFEEIVAAMADTATVADHGGYPSLTTIPRPAAPAAMRPVAPSTCPATSPAVGRATVPGDRRLQQTPPAAAAGWPGRPRSGVAVCAALTVVALVAAAPAAFTVVTSRLGDVPAWQTAAVVAVCALMLAGVPAVATVAVRVAARYVARQFYRGRHTHPGANDERRVAWPRRSTRGHDLRHTPPVAIGAPACTRMPAGRGPSRSTHTWAGLYGDTLTTGPGRATVRGIAKVPAPGIPRPRREPGTPESLAFAGRDPAP